MLSPPLTTLPNICDSANLARLQIRVYIAYVFIGATWVLTTCLLLFGCRPMSKYWQISPDPGSKSISFDINSRSSTNLHLSLSTYQLQTLRSVCFDP